jgi:type III secretion protein J
MHARPPFLASLPRLSLGLALIGLLACNVPVAGELLEDDANEVSVALEHAGIDSTKEADPHTEGKFQVLVSRDDATRAAQALREEALPKKHPKGVLESVGQGSLVPSPAAEHAQYVAGLSGDLERSLLGIEGVHSARVHLNIPPVEAFRPEKQKSTASVLIEHKGPTPPIGPDAVQKLVSGSVQNLAGADVSVIFVPRSARVLLPSDRLAHVGPLAVAKGSLRVFQGVAGGAMVVLVGLASLCLLLLLRISKLRKQIDTLEADAAGKQPKGASGARPTAMQPGAHAQSQHPGVPPQGPPGYAPPQHR